MYSCRPSPCTEGHGAGLDRDAALLLELHVVEHLLVHLARGDGAAALEDAVGQRRLPVVDVGDDREVADELGVGHGGTADDTRSRSRSGPGGPIRRLDSRSEPDCLPAAIASARTASSGGAPSGVPQEPGPGDHRGVVGRERRVREGGRGRRFSPQRASVARSSELAATPPESARRADALAAVDSSRRGRGAPSRSRAGRTRTGRRAPCEQTLRVERRAVDAALLELAEHRRLQAGEGKVIGAVAGASDGKREPVAVARAPRCGRRRGRPGSRGRPARHLVEGLARRVVAGPRERARCGPSSTRTSSAWPPETTRPWKRVAIGSGGSPSVRRHGEEVALEMVDADERQAARPGERLARPRARRAAPRSARDRPSPRPAPTSSRRDARVPRALPRAPPAGSRDGRARPPRERPRRNARAPRAARR